MVLSACPDIVDYAKGGISNWRDFLAAAAVVRPDAGNQSERLGGGANDDGRGGGGGSGGLPAAAKFYDQSAGGYLRELTRKAGEGEFSLGPILMAQINAKKRERRSA